jgi:hypothetical protein
MNHVLCGIDAGQADTTAAFFVPGARGGVTRGRVETITFPSLVGTGDVDRFLRMRAAGGGEAALREGEYVLEHGGTGYFVGPLALSQSKGATTGRGDPNRYTSLTLYLMLTAFGLAIEQGWMKDGADVRMVTGMPLEYWSPQKRALVQQFLVGEHGFGFGGKKRHVRLDAVGVPPEAAATLYKTAGQPIHQCVLDIGWGSREAYWALGRDAVAERCKGSQHGVSVVADLINDQVRRNFGRALSEFEVRMVLRAWRANPEKPDYPLMHSSGKVITLDGIVPSAVDTVGREQATWAGQVWGSEDGQVASEAAVARMIGGGAYYFGSHIHEVIPHIEIPELPEEENARSYLEIARAASEEAWARSRG